MFERAQLLDVHATLTPADHQTHRRFTFKVPARCRALQIHFRYAPKFLSEPESAGLVDAALRQQTVALASRVGAPLAERWAASVSPQPGRQRLPNLLTLSFDDATGAYRGAVHRQADDQRLTIGPESASPGLVAGVLTAGEWRVTLSAHTVVSPQCDVSIQIGAEMASSD